MDRQPPRPPLFPSPAFFRSEHHRAGARAATAMRRRESLVQVDVHGIDAEIARLRLADDGVEVRAVAIRSEEHTSELQSRQYLVCRLLLEKKKNTTQGTILTQ